MLRQYFWSSKARTRWKPPDPARFSGYTAGRLWTPPAGRKKLNLKEEYQEILETVVKENQANLAAHFDLRSQPNSRRTFRTILNRLQTEYYGPSVPVQSEEDTKLWCPAKQYNTFLFELYRKPIKLPKVLEAMANLPQPTARYVYRAHLRDMMAFARQKNDSKAYMAVFEALERVSYEFSSFERAEALLLMSKNSHSEKQLRDKFASWRAHFGSGDLRVLNVLLNAGVNADSAELQSFALDQIKSHGLKPDRLTFHCLMRRARNRPVELKALFREFCDQGFIIDISTLYIMMQGLLQSGYIAAAENFLHQLLRNSPNTHVVDTNPNQLSMLLWMIDRTRQLSTSDSQVTQMVSLVPDERLLLAFANKYLEMGDFAKLCDMLKQLANHGNPSRDLIYRVTRAFRHQWSVQEFDVFVSLVLDIANDLPLMTESLANALQMTHQKLRPSDETSIYDLCLAF